MIFWIGRRGGAKFFQARPQYRSYFTELYYDRSNNIIRSSFFLHLREILQAYTAEQHINIIL